MRILDVILLLILIAAFGIMAYLSRRETRRARGFTFQPDTEEIVLNRLQAALAHMDDEPLPGPFQDWWDEFSGE